MAHLHCYVSEELAARAQRRAQHLDLSLSSYLAELVKHDVNAGWPEGYFDLFGKWEGAPLERLTPLPFEGREV